METTSFSKEHPGTTSSSFQKSQNQLEYIGKKEETGDEISSSPKIEITPKIQEKLTSKNIPLKKKKKEKKKTKKNKEEVISDESNEIKEVIDDNSQDSTDVITEA